MVGDAGPKLRQWLGLVKVVVVIVALATVFEGIAS
jgi:hypothetical protein